MSPTPLFFSFLFCFWQWEGESNANGREIGSYLTHYSYFGSFRSDVSNVGPNAAMLTQKGELTDIGSWYLGGTATGKVPKGAAAGKKAVFAGSGFLVVMASVWTLL